jgi:tetratricopeptide (TPR) repeat protein
MTWLALALLVAQAPAQDAAEPAPAEAKESEAVGLLREGHSLIEVKANTRDNLTRGLAVYEQALADPSLSKRQRIEAYVDMSRACLRLGDLAKGATALSFYEQGREVAQRALALDDKHADAMFWDMANLASVGQSRGIMNSLFMVPDLKKGFGRVLELDANHSYARETLAKVYHEVPSLVGGDAKKAEALLKETLERDPRFTPSMVVLAKFYIDKKRYDEARPLLQKVIDMPSSGSSIPQDHWRFTVPEAKKLLASLEGK